MASVGGSSSGTAGAAKTQASTGSSEPGGAEGRGSRGPKTSKASTRRERTPRETQNAIREYALRARKVVTPRPKASAATLREPDLGAGAKAASNTPGGTPLPEEVARRFVQVGKHFYFPDGARAFTDHGKRLSTPSENTEVIRSLISVAQTRGWQEIAVSGTERFRKEAWMAARLAGLNVRGYKPTEFEQERLVRTLGRQHHESEREVGAGPAPAESKAPEAANDRRTRRDTHGQTDELITGRLVDHGRAPYRDDPKRPLSYFVTVETSRGDRTFWGVDLERAVRQSLSQPKVGDQIALRTVRRDPVTVKAIERDQEGKVSGNKDVAAHRNRWVVETREFFAQRAAAAKTFVDPNIQATKGAREHPELLGSYLQLRSAEELATQRLKNPKDRKAFVARVRHVLANSIAQGEPLSPVQIREHASGKNPTRPPRQPEREHAAIR